jgi:MFS family permease
MILLGAMELTGKKITLPMLNLTVDLTNNRNPWTVYVLGVFSGLTSSCCTPVLAGILTLSFLSPTFLWAGLAGVAYVTGMVIPLVVLALLLERVDWMKIIHLKGKTVQIGKKKIPVTDAMAGVLFVVVGVIFSALALTGNITMGTGEPLEESLGINLMNIVRFLQTIPGSELIFAILIIGVLIKLFRKERKRV